MFSNFIFYFFRIYTNIFFGRGKFNHLIFSLTLSNKLRVRSNDVCQNHLNAGHFSPTRARYSATWRFNSVRTNSSNFNYFKQTLNLNILMMTHLCVQLRSIYLHHKFWRKSNRRIYLKFRKNWRIWFITKLKSKKT